MRKILVFTDTHITAGQDIIGLDPSTRLAAGLQHATTQHPDAERIIITGDLTHHGRPDQYEALRSLLSDLTIPVTLMLGNHDRRAPFLASFPQTETQDGFVQTTHDIGNHRLICLDTLDEEAPDRHSGWLCQARLAYLDAALKTDKICTVFMHHPPTDTGFAGMDRIKLRNGDATLKVLHNRCAHLICGHVHRTINIASHGMAISILKSTCHQQPMTLSDPRSSSSVDEPGAYGVLLLRQSHTSLLPEDFTLPAPQISHDTASETSL